MGNLNSEQQSHSQQSGSDIIGQHNRKPTLVIDEQLIIVQLRMLIGNVVKQFQSFEQQVTQFKNQLKLSKQFYRGQDFEGRVKEGKVYGIAKYFSRKDLDCNLYFGECIDGKPKGRGINIKTKLVINSNENKILDIHEYEAYLLNDWLFDRNQPQKGSVLKSVGNTITYFKGQLQNQSFLRGTMIVKKQDIIKLKYFGQFKYNRIEGHGSLQIPGVYEYKGNFERQQKSGIGWQKDFIRQTQYTGQFQNDKRHGYGELSYGKNREDVKLKGFWTNGIIKSGEGMYVSKDGVFMESIGDDIQLL